MIFKDLYGQKEEIEQKEYYDYEEIPEKTRRKIAYILVEHCRGNIDGRLSQLRYELCKHFGIPIFYPGFDTTNAIEIWILTDANITEVLRTIEIYLELQRCNETWVRMHGKTIEEINDTFSIDKIGYKINKDNRRI
ncbi:MAG: hypothetical protein KAT91_04845, partial [Candidatus Aenigmarchaeota archaeon]|nr:hypothetical protein [Candidatus Aenigmarchaeota archaeon]